MQNTNQGGAVIDRKSRYSLRIEILAYPTCIRGPVRGIPIGISSCRFVRKTRRMELPDGKSLKICLFILTESTNVTDTQTDIHRMTAKAALDASIARQSVNICQIYAVQWHVFDSQCITTRTQSIWHIGQYIYAQYRA